MIRILAAPVGRRLSRAARLGGAGPLAILVLLPALPVHAEKALTPQYFLDRAEGRTLTMVVPETGEIIGVERFLGRDRTVWSRSSGPCTHGTVEVRGAKVCFRYDDELPWIQHCWAPFLKDGALHARLASSGEVQRVERITDDFIGCDGEPLS